MNISNQKAYWDKVAEYKNFTTPVSMELLKKYLRPDSIILDFGCGQGRILQQLKNEGFLNLSGVDISRNMIEIAGKNLPDADFKVNTGVMIPYNDSSFDCVVAAAVLGDADAVVSRPSTATERFPILQSNKSAPRADIPFGLSTKTSELFRLHCNVI